MDGHAAQLLMLMEHLVMAQAAGADVASVAAGLPVGLLWQLSLIIIVVVCLTGHR